MLVHFSFQNKRWLKDFSVCVSFFSVFLAHFKKHHDKNYNRDNVGHNNHDVKCTVTNLGEGEPDGSTVLGQRLRSEVVVNWFSLRTHIFFLLKNFTKIKTQVHFISCQAKLITELIELKSCKNNNTLRIVFSNKHTRTNIHIYCIQMCTYR